MAKKTESLPRKTISNPATAREAQIVSLAADLSHKMQQLAPLQAEIKNLKDELAQWCSDDRDSEADHGNYIGLYEIVPTEFTPSRVEFKMSNSGKTDNRVLELDQKEVLDNLMGKANREALFEEEYRLKVNDPIKLVNDLAACGYNPNEMLDISVKAGREQDVAELSANFFDVDSNSVEKWHVLSPKKGFLKTLQGKQSSTSAARGWLKKYLTEVLKPYVYTDVKVSEEN